MLFLSLGGGVQSSVMLMRALAGDIERPDHVLFADTGWDGAKTLAHVDWLEKKCQAAGVPFHRVSAGNIREDNLIARTADSGEYKGRWASMPYFVDTGSGVEGRIKRQCTQEYKLEPLRKKQRELLGYQPRQRIPPGAAATMVGISTDEARRAHPARDRWVDNLYPLIDPLRMSRLDCQAWWDEHFPWQPLGKSSCLGCPNKSDREWADLKLNSPEEWAEVVAFDAVIRHATGMRGQSYLHRSLRPLGQINFNELQSAMDLEDAIYCAGGCGL
jgi:3'-phosphoadenosine 5'-phosphosulfate sulfotransferase (PAPS reductase)/FAD synthetase